MTINRKITDLPKDIFTNAIAEVASEKEVDSILRALSRSNKHFYRIFQETLFQKVTRAFLEAVIDDDCSTLKRIMDAKPDLLLSEPPCDVVIESKLTWQRFYAEKPAIMAAKRKQSKTFTLLLSYYDKLPQTDEVMNAKVEVIAAWSFYEINKNANGKDEIIIPEKYISFAKLLIDVFREELFANVENEYGYGMLSEKTEDALAMLFNRILPEQSVKLDDYVDVEMLLLATYKVYFDHIDTFRNWNQRYAFGNRVIGLLQSVQTPETAKIFCEGINSVVTAIKKREKKEISDPARAHRLKSGEAFYRSSRPSKKGPGYDSMCGIFGFSLANSHGIGACYIEWFKAYRLFEKFLLHKNNKLKKIAKQYIHPKTNLCLIM